jgi:peptidoglycan/xylan/chitin deacetylase (PgdA/CDA1 family)
MKALILLYHRIAYPGVDPWSLCVTPECFSEHMEVLRRIAHPFSLTELVRARAAGAVPDGAIAVTFDDGYLDNLTNAKPILDRHEVPATVFVCSGAVGREEEFWWDELDRAFLQSDKRLRGPLALEVASERLTWTFGDTASGAENDASSPPDGKSPDALALSACMTIWRALRPLSHQCQAAAIREIKAWANLPDEARPTHRTMNAYEIAALAAGGLVEIGAHTVSHPLLPAHSREVQEREILDSRSRLGEIIASPIQHFAYPFGKYDETTVDILRNAGFASACNTVPTALTPRHGIYELPRLAVKNWSSDQFAEIVQNLLNIPDSDLPLGARVRFPLEAFKRQTGKLRNGAIECLPAKHRPGHCLFGPDFRIAENGQYRLGVLLEQQDPEDVVLDVYENHMTKKVLAETDPDGKSKLRLLEFSAERGNVVEFRVYWRGRGRLTIRRIHLERMS